MEQAINICTKSQAIKKPEYTDDQSMHHLYQNYFHDHHHRSDRQYQSQDQYHYAKDSYSQDGIRQQSIIRSEGPRLNVIMYYNTDDATYFGPGGVLYWVSVYNDLNLSPQM